MVVMLICVVLFYLFFVVVALLFGWIVPVGYCKKEIKSICKTKGLSKRDELKAYKDIENAIFNRKYY